MSDKPPIDSLDTVLKEGLGRESPAAKPPSASMVPHGKERLWIASIALALCLGLPALPSTPDSIRAGMLAIAGSISTSLFKSFEKS